MSEFESLGLKSGIWQGILRRETPPGRLLLVHMGSPVAEALATAEPEGGWRVAAAIPPELLSDGVQSFLLVEDRGAAAEPLQAGAHSLGSLTLIAGALLDDDLLAEMTLMRAELELLKKELRRLAAAIG
ncbi:hypothetical protein SAMN04488021_12015 [Paracoccus aminovorans]|uniref:Uncharacterized protein n=1 Tax=Paracoccus aminovorans TaxID=34004 RepID=A0A1I3B868_9RHOB|nr:hypothetical protein [Paracoccus aminovorans]CQR85411.1 hypothetical protein JCM7685_0832 [Paracoccus aminovorans]SFH58468.1 hypothetical protein SAMN04488021_12015 [Paracoccus aminovorans]